MIPSLMNGSDWTGENVGGWWLSEKLDGWRAYWDGSRLLRRSGIEYGAPSWFTDGLPARPLDGELWAGPKTTHDDVLRAVRDGRWQDLTLRVFDVPAPGLRIEEALTILRELPSLPHVKPVEYQRATSTAEALTIMQRIIRAGGEGVMLRRPGSPYLTERRTIALLKMKGGGK